jgi:hypothetical protein
MDFQQFLEQFAPRDYSQDLDPADKIEFSKRYKPGDADEETSFLAKHKALPYQNDVASFDDPDFFTGLRREAGFFTGKEKALIQKQQRLINDELKPIQEARQKLGLQLAAHMMSMDQWKQQQDYNTPTLDQARAQGYGPDVLPAAPGQIAQAPLVGPMPGQMREGITGPPTAQTAGVNLWPSVGAMQRDFREKAPAFFEEQPRPFQQLEVGSAKLDPAQRQKVDQLQRLELQQGKALTPEQIYGRGMLMDYETAKLERDQWLEDHPGEPVPRDIQAKLGLMEPAPGEVGTEMGATAARSPLTGLKGVTPTEYLGIQQQALQRFKEGRRETRTDKDVSLPVREWLAGEGLPPTPANIKTGTEVLRQRKNADDQEAIKLKELLQTGPQDVRIQLAKQGKTILDASPDEMQQAISDAAEQELSVAERKKIQEFQLSPIGEEQQAKLLGLQQIARVTHRLKTEFTEAERRKYVGYFNQPVERVKQLIQADPRFAKFDALVNREGIAAFETGGKALTAQEAKIIFGFLPQGGEMSPENFEAKLIEGDDYARTKISDIVKIATSNRRDIGKAMTGNLPKKPAKKSPAQRYNELEKQGMKEADIYNQLVVEGYK